MLRRHLTAIPAVLAAGAILAACGGAGTPSSSSGGGGAAGTPTLTETAQEYAFGTPALTVSPGATVTIAFTNTGTVTHNMTQSDLKINQDASPGQTATITFTAPQSGSFTFHCAYHPTKMMGTITVSGSSAAAVPTTAPTSAGAYTPYGY